MASKPLASVSRSNEVRRDDAEPQRRGTFIAHYLDGVQESRIDWLALPRAVARIRIGRVGAGGLATLDEVRFYTGALSEAEIMDLATPF